MKCTGPALALFIMIYSFSSPIFAQGYDEIFAYARTLIKQGEYSKAAAEGRKAIALDKSRWEGFYVAAAGYAGANDCDAALPYFQSALERGVPEAIRAAIASATQECEAALVRAPQVSLKVNRDPQSPALTNVIQFLTFTYQDKGGKLLSLATEEEHCVLRQDRETWRKDVRSHRDGDQRTSWRVPLAALDAASVKVEGRSFTVQGTGEPIGVKLEEFKKNIWQAPRQFYKGMQDTWSVWVPDLTISLDQIVATLKEAIKYCRGPQ